MRVLKNFKSVRDPLRPRSSYIEQVILLAFNFIHNAVVVSKLEKASPALHHVISVQSALALDTQLKRDIMTYYEYNDFLAGYILNLFPFDEAVEFIQVRPT